MDEIFRRCCQDLTTTSSLKRRLALAVAVAAIAAGGATAAVSATGQGISQPGATHLANRRAKRLLNTAASYLGIPATQLRSELQSGKTLAHSEALLAPQPLNPPTVHHPAFLAQRGMRTPVAPPWPLPGELSQPATQRSILPCHTGLPALGRAVLTDIPAGPTLRETKTILEHQDRGSTTRRAHQFPRDISRSARFSSSLSATSRFNCAFSRSSSFNRFTSLGALQRLRYLRH
jgi:hypothetical protein